MYIMLVIVLITVTVLLWNPYANNNLHATYSCTESYTKIIVLITVTVLLWNPLQEAQSNKFFLLI